MDKAALKAAIDSETRAIMRGYRKPDMLAGIALTANANQSGRCDRPGYPAPSRDLPPMPRDCDALEHDSPAIPGRLPSPSGTSPLSNPPA